MNKVSVHAFVSGRVQGVYFRQSTKEQALKQVVTGWAKNLVDGRVEVLLCGDCDRVEKVQQWLHEGPPLARVEKVVFEAQQYQQVVGFFIS